MAILAGDALLTLAFEYICRETRGVAPERIVRVRIHCEEAPCRVPQIVYAKLP